MDESRNDLSVSLNQYVHSICCVLFKWEVGKTVHAIVVRFIILILYWRRLENIAFKCTTLACV